MKRQTDLKKEVRRFYEKYPCGGNSTKDDRRHEICPWMPEAFEYDKWSGKLLLDVGCGTGIDMTTYCANGATVVGIDLAKKPLLMAHQRLSELGLRRMADFVRCDLERMPLKERSFDMAYSIGVLHHTPNPGKGAAEIYRVLKNQGKAIVLLYHEYSIAMLITRVNRILYLLFGDSVIRLVKLVYKGGMNPADIAAWREIWQHPLVQYFTRQSASRLFECAGFKVVIKIFDAMYPISRIFPSVQKHDILKNFLGRFIILIAFKY